MISQISSAGWLASLPPPFSRPTRLKTSRGNGRAGVHLELARPSGEKNIVSRAHTASLARTHARSWLAGWLSDWLAGPHLVAKSIVSLEDYPGKVAPKPAAPD